MKKIFKNLTDDQIERGVIFSSQLIPNGKLHEVTEENYLDCSEGTNKIQLLLEDSFFNNSPYKYNEIRHNGHKKVLLNLK